MGGRANPLMDRKVVVIFGVVAVPHPQLQHVVRCSECNVIVVVGVFVV